MGLLIILFLLAALVWMIPVVHAERLFPVAVLVVLLGTVFGPKFFNVQSVIQLSIDRVLWGAMIALALIQFRIGNVKMFRLTRLDWIVLAFVGYVFLSAMTGISGEYATKAFSRWLFYIVMPAGLYLIARLVELRESDVRFFFKAVVGLAIYLSLTGLCEVLGIHALVFPKYILNPEEWEFLGRARGPLMNPIGNGFVLSIGFVVSVFAFFNGNRQMKLVYGCVTLLILAGAYATLTRSVWIGVILATGLMILIHTPRWVRVLGVAAALLFGGALMMGLKDTLMSLKRDKQLSAADSAKSIELRPLLAVIALEMFKDKPIVGHGYGRYFEFNKNYSSIRSYDMDLEEVRGYYQHNAFLAILVDTGLIGLLLLVSIILSLAGLAWRLARERVNTPLARQVGLLAMSVLIVYVFNGMFHDMMIIPMVQMFLFVIAGMAVTIHQRGFAAPCARSSSRQEEPVTNNRRPESNPAPGLATTL